jgi:putative Ca2+/H+ antiporter (TMEM165/GDT1 family)
MTVLSAAFGLVFLKFIPPTITRWVSVALFAIFGLKMLYEGYKMTPADAAEEMNEVQSDLGKRETEVIFFWQI